MPLFNYIDVQSVSLIISLNKDEKSLNNYKNVKNYVKNTKMLVKRGLRDLFRKCEN